MSEQQNLQLLQQRLKVRGLSESDVDGVVDDLSGTLLQTYLNTVSVKRARKHAATLRELVSENKNIAYVGLESLTAVYTGQLTVDTSAWSNNSVRYTSPHFHATAKVFSIANAQTHHDIGFVQTCESRTQQQLFSNDGVSTQWDIVGGLPKSDSSSENNMPWYHVGIGNGCSNATAKRDHALSEEETFELDDNFNNIGTHGKLSYLKSSVWTKTAIKTIRRKQAFRAWFAVKPTQGSVYRLLKQIDYAFDFKIDFTHNVNNSPPSYVITNNPGNITQKDPDPDAALPFHALNGQTTNGGDQLNVYVNGAYKCPISQTIAL